MVFAERQLQVSLRNPSLVCITVTKRSIILSVRLLPDQNLTCAPSIL